MSKKNRNYLLRAPIFSALIRFAIPILLAASLQTLYGAIDLWAVSRFGFDEDISAVSTGSQIMMIVNGMVIGLSMGTAILLGEAYGRKRYRDVARIIATGLKLFGIIALFITGILISIAGPIAKALNAPEDAYSKTVLYIVICGTGVIFIVAYNFLNAIFIGIGDSKTPFFFTCIAALVNIIIDYILVNILKLGAAGTAVATVGAQGVSVICAIFLIKRRLPLAIIKAHMSFIEHLIPKILKLGAPLAFLYMCEELSFLIILKYTNVLGVAASAGVGIAKKIILFAMLIPEAFESAITVFVAQNKGAGNFERARKSLWTGMAAMLAFGVTMTCLSLFKAEFLASFFKNTPWVKAAAAEFLRATAFESTIMAAALAFEGYFEGSEKTAYVMFQGTASSMLIRVPFARRISTLPNPSIADFGVAMELAAVFRLVTGIIYYIILIHDKKTAAEMHNAA